MALFIPRLPFERNCLAFLDCRHLKGVSLTCQCDEGSRSYFLICNGSLTGIKVRGVGKDRDSKGTLSDLRIHLQASVSCGPQLS